MLPFLYIVMMIQCAISEEKQYISNLKESESAEKYVQDLR